MLRYEFKKLEPDKIESNLYTSNWCGGGGSAGVFYKQEDIICFLAQFVHTFAPVEKAIKEMKKDLQDEFKVAF